MTHGRYAVVLTHNRPELLQRCVRAIYPQVDRVVVIDNASQPRVTLSGLKIRLLYSREQPPNLSRLWNVGIDWVYAIAQEHEHETHDVALLCDDAVVDATWFDRVTDTMRHTSAVAGSTHSAIDAPGFILKTEPDHDVWNRMCPWAFMIRGEVTDLRADEDLKWWWGDTHMDFTARKLGGMVIAPGPVVRNEKMGEYTNIYTHLAEQAGRDGETFAAKWGQRPW